MNYVKLVNVKLSVEEISNLVSSPRCGAISLFVGTTRDNFQDQKVLQLEYEAYEPMAIKAMSDICGEIRTKWPSVENIAIYHRLGIVPVKEASVVIAVSSPHRLESLEAVGHTIEALKASVPIWKKEVYESDKPAEWKENKELISNLSKKRKTNVEGLPDDCPSHSSDQQAHGNIGFTPIDPKLVQIKADAQEIERRMKCFIDRKREDLNVINNRDFCNHTSVPGEENSNSCARVDALLVRRTGSKSHLRIRRVFNKWGPQTTRGSAASREVPSEQPANETRRQEDVASAWEPRFETTPTAECPQPSAVEERLRNAEQHLKLDGPVPRDVYTRVKRIEARILYLEGISPEYSSFWVTQAGFNSGHHIKAKPKTKKIYTLEDLETKMNTYHNELVHK